MAGTLEKTEDHAEGIIRWSRVEGVADAADGSFPAKTLRELGIYIDGVILCIITNPGTTAPSDNWDLTLIDENGIDRFEGRVLNRDTTSSEMVRVNALASLNEELTLTPQSNAVNSAEIMIDICWTPAIVDIPPWSFDGNLNLEVSDSATQTYLAGIGLAVHQADDAAAADIDLMGVHGVANEAADALAGTDGDVTPLSTTLKGSVHVRPDSQLIKVTIAPTHDANAHVANDTLTACVELANVVRFAGGSGRIVKFMVHDGDLQSKSIQAHITDRSITVPALNAAWSISDADNAFHVAQPTSSGYSSSALNSEAIGDPSLAFTCKSDSTSLYVTMVALEAITPTASGITYSFLVAPDR